MNKHRTARGSGPQTPSSSERTSGMFPLRRSTHHLRSRFYLIIAMLAVSGLLLGGLAIADHCDDSDAHTTCSSCGGSGGSWEEDSYTVDCDECDGEGTIETTTKCSDCGGSGEVSCPDCGGDGYTSEEDGDMYFEYGCTSCGGSGEQGWQGSDYGDGGFVSGSGTVTCSSCGGSGSETSSSKCTSCNGKGYTWEYDDYWDTCSTCSGKGYTGSHTYSSKVTKAATCTTSGTCTYTCTYSACGHSYTETIAATGHSYTSEVTKAATCTSTGVRTYTCSNCSNSYTETIAKTSHSYSPTNTDYGDCSGAVYTYTCSNCSDMYTFGTKYDSHNYVNQGTVYGECRGSVTIYTCSRCSDTYTSGTAYDTHSYTSKVTTAATCTSTGVLTYTCSYCSDSYTETIAATGHSYSLTKTVNGSCSGAVYTYTCSNCSDSYTSGTKYDTHDYVKDGSAYWYNHCYYDQDYECSRCGATTYDRLSTSHSYTVLKSVTKAATCTSSGTAVYQCAYHSSATTTKAISATGHSYSADSYSWASDCSSCTVTWRCSNDSSHTGTATYTPTSSTSGNATTYSVSGTNSTYGSYSSSKVLYSFVATLSYDANGGSGAPGNQTDTVQLSSSTASGSKTFTVSSSKPTRSGYDFLGWNTSSSATTASVQPGSTVSVSYGSTTTLYAVWKQSTFTHTIVYASNGGSGSMLNTVVTNTTSGSSSVTLASNGFTKTGYHFTGWIVNGTTYQAGAKVPVSGDSSVTATAQWARNTLSLGAVATQYAVVGHAVSFSPTTSSDPSGASVSYTASNATSGLTVTVSGSVVSCTASSTGTFTFTLTASATNYQSSSGTVTVVVVPVLEFANTPAAGQLLS